MTCLLLLPAHICHVKTEKNGSRLQMSNFLRHSEMWIFCYYELEQKQCAFYAMALLAVLKEYNIC